MRKRGKGPAIAKGGYGISTRPPITVIMNRVIL